jgi:hypothetical protein
VLTDEGLRAVSSLPALTSLNLSRCRAVSAAGVQAVCNTTATLVRESVAERRVMPLHSAVPDISEPRGYIAPCSTRSQQVLQVPVTPG